jgi:ubiquitin-conjugating enzyme E2 T
MNVGRVRKEIEMLAREPGPGVSAWAAEEGSVTQLAGQITGPEESPYDGGVFSVSITVPQR